MTSIGSDLEHVLVGERELWQDGPPHDLFRRLRGECPVHWTSKITEYPNEAGYWSVTTADDVHAVSRDWQTYSSERGGVTAVTDVFPLELARAMFIGRGVSSGRSRRGCVSARRVVASGNGGNAELAHAARRPPAHASPVQ